MSKLRGVGDQVLNFNYKSYLTSDVMAMNNAYLHTPGYLFKNISLGSDSGDSRYPNYIEVDGLSAIIEPTNPTYAGELMRMHITTTFEYPDVALVDGTDDYLVIRYTHIAGDDTVGATITSTTSGGILSTDVVVCKLEYTTSNLTGFDYEDSLVTKSAVLPSIFKKFRYDVDGTGSSPEASDTIVQKGNQSFSTSTTAVVVFPTEFGTVQKITCTPEMAADASWRISTSSTTGFTVTFSASSTGTLYWDAEGI